MKKVLHVLNIYFGIPYFLGNQLNYMQSKGYEEHIICSPSPEVAKYANIYNFKYNEINILRSISPIEDIKAIKTIKRYIKKNRIDIVVGHTPKGALLSMCAAKLCNVRKRIYFRHGLVFETSMGLKRQILKIIDRFTASLATQVINVSESISTIALEEKLNPSYKQKILNNGTCNGIDINKFDINSIDIKKCKELRNSLNIEEGDFIIGFTGRLVKDKGIIDLIEAFELLQNHYNFKSIKLLLVGILEERDALPNMITEKIKSNKNIICTGYVNFQDIENYYSLMDIFILPSYREGFPTSTLEASSMKIPILTTKVTGCINSIIEGETGIFIDHNPKNIMLAISSFIDNPNLINEFGENGRKFVENNFRQELIWKEIEKLYE